MFYLNTTQLSARLTLITHYEREFILEGGNLSVKNLQLNKSVTGITLCTAEHVMLHVREL